jgi:hypothetical protein
VGQKTRGEKFEQVFSFEGFCGKKQFGNSDTEIDQHIKDHLVNLQSRFPKYFPKGESDKYKEIRINSMLSHPNITTVLTLYVIILQKFNFLGSRTKNFGWVLQRSSLSPSRKASNILLPFATSDQCQTVFSEVAAIRTKYHSVKNPENSLRAVISRF